eukprot:GHRQ01036662.1.p1 GENE.GHRQ01036662.1~~GHRQ01036662.1.p1  ORF type:complete len:137 (+),score=38.69 GHRQ01036662.1:168-578(+)
MSQCCYIRMWQAQQSCSSYVQLSQQQSHTDLAAHCCLPLQGGALPAMSVLLGEFGSKDQGDNSVSNADTTAYSDADKRWLRDTAAYVRRLSHSAGSPASWFFWAWNANSGTVPAVTALLLLMLLCGSLNQLVGELR